MPECFKRLLLSSALLIAIAPLRWQPFQAHPSSPARAASSVWKNEAIPQGTTYFKGLARHLASNPQPSRKGKAAEECSCAAASKTRKNRHLLLSRVDLEDSDAPAPTSTGPVLRERRLLRPAPMLLRNGTCMKAQCAKHLRPEPKSWISLGRAPGSLTVSKKLNRGDNRLTGRMKLMCGSTAPSFHRSHQTASVE